MASGSGSESWMYLRIAYQAKNQIKPRRLMKLECLGVECAFILPSFKFSHFTILLNV